MMALAQSSMPEWAWPGHSSSSSNTTRSSSRSMHISSDSGLIAAANSSAPCPYHLCYIRTDCKSLQRPFGGETCRQLP